MVKERVGIIMIALVVSGDGFYVNRLAEPKGCVEIGAIRKSTSGEWCFDSSESYRIYDMFCVHSVLAVLNDKG